MSFKNTNYSKKAKPQTGYFRLLKQKIFQSGKVDLFFKMKMCFCIYYSYVGIRNSLKWEKKP